MAMAGTTITTATIAISTTTMPVPMITAAAAAAACAVAGGGAAAGGDDHHDAHRDNNNAAADDGPRTAIAGASMSARMSAADRCHDCRRTAGRRYNAGAPCRHPADSRFPTKTAPPEPHHQKIRHQAGVAAVAIREWMNLHQPVMQAHRDLVGRISLVSIRALVSSSKWRSATGIS